jgi:hypothetical protein
MPGNRQQSGIGSADTWRLGRELAGPTERWMSPDHLVDNAGEDYTRFDRHNPYRLALALGSRYIPACQALIRRAVSRSSAAPTSGSSPKSKRALAAVQQHLSGLR